MRNHNKHRNPIRKYKGRQSKKSITRYNEIKNHYQRENLKLPIEAVYDKDLLLASLVHKHDLFEDGKIPDRYHQFYTEINKND